MNGGDGGGGGGGGRPEPPFSLILLKCVFTLLVRFYTQQLLSTPIYLHERGLNNQQVFPKQKY